MLDLLVVLLVLAVALTAALWFGSLFLQSYFYTEASEGLFWQAPAAALVMTGFYLLWSLLNVWGATTMRLGKVEIPYGVLWEFSVREDVIAEPVPRFESKRRYSEAALYVLDLSVPDVVKYRRQDGEEFWSAMGVDYVAFRHDDQDYKFVRDRTRDDAYAVFVDEKTGLEMREFEIGRVGYDSYSRLLVYGLLNGMHLVLWIACFWLVLRFQLSHAVGLAVVMWIVFTMTVLPGLCDKAAGAVL